MRDAESLAHLAYGEMIKRFHLGTAHVFTSWQQLSEDEQSRWIAVFAEVRKRLEEEASAESRAQQASQAPMSVH